MAAVKARHPKASLTLIGQSLWGYFPGIVSYQESPAYLIGQGRDVTTYPTWRSGFAYLQFLSSTMLQSEINRTANAAPKAIGVAMGGTTDIAVSVSGATTYSRLVTIAQNFKAAGGTHFIASTTTPSTTFTSPQNTQLAALNAAIIANADGAFDSVVNLAANASLDDPADTTYYWDGTHPTAAGAAVISTLLGAAVDSLL